MSSYNEIFSKFIASLDNVVYSLYAVEEFTLKSEKVCFSESLPHLTSVAIALRESKRYCPNIDLSYKNLKFIIINENTKEEISI